MKVTCDVMHGSMDYLTLWYFMGIRRGCALRERMLCALSLRYPVPRA